MEAARVSNASSTNASDMETRSNSNWSGPLGKRSTGKKSARFSDDAGSSSSITGVDLGGGPDDSEYVEVIVNVTQKGIEIENPELSLLGKTLEQRPSFVRSASAKLRQFSHELKASLSLSRKGAASAAESARNLDRSKTAARRALKGLKLLSKTTCAHDWATVSQKFDSLAVDGALPRRLFAQCIGMKESIEFAGELFDGLARRRGITVGAITKEELKEFWEQIHDQSFDVRLQTFFDMVDKDADGRITEAEIKEVIEISASANKLSKVKDQAEEYSALIMEELDPNDLGYIEIENLQMLLLEGPGQSVRHAVTASRNLSQMISQKLVSKKTRVIERWFEKTKFFLEDNWQRVWVLLLWLAIVAGLFTWKFIQYKRKSVFDVMGYCVCAAKGAAETLKFNMALILLPVCRNTITWLRNKTKMGVAVPFDDNLNFHKVIAAAVAIGVGIHALAHLTCDFPRLLHASEQDYIPLRTFFGHNKPPNYWWFVKGFEGISGIIMIVLMAIAFTLAMPWFRRNRLADKLPKPLKKLTGFNAFWYSHHLFVIVYILLVLHGIFLYLTHKWYKKTTWMYLAVPVCLYAGERVLRAFRSGYKSVNLIKVAIYPGNVMSIRMSKPPGFNYRSGQYMFVNCPAVSPFEWHPFSITSAPGDDYLSVHIRTLGDWTRSLKDVFGEVCEPSTADKSGLLRADCLQGEYIPGFPKLSIDGPYGAPAQDYRQYDVLLLVGLGIGATPMISIVKDIINNMKLKQEENDMEAAMAAAKRNNNRSKSFNTTRAYFYWVTREQGSFEWFREVMNEVAVIDKEGVIELHNYCTSVYEEGDARSALIAMLQALHHAKHGVDVVSGTKVKTHFAKPKWRDVFKRIAVNHKDAKIGVFYCGAPGLTGELRQLASHFTHKTGTRFDFHKENF